MVKIDILFELITLTVLEGVSSDMITVESVNHVFDDGQIAEGLGIFAGEYLEAVYTGEDLSTHLLSMTSGFILQAPIRSWIYLCFFFIISPIQRNGLISY